MKPALNGLAGARRSALVGSCEATRSRFGPVKRLGRARRGELDGVLAAPCTSESLHSAGAAPCKPPYAM
jgi:hypothetical protein